MNEPTESERPARPRENSASITGIPSINMQHIYTKRNAPPPFSCAKLGNLHTLPNPTAEPTVAAIRPNFELKVVFFDIFVYLFSASGGKGKNNLAE